MKIFGRARWVRANYPDSGTRVPTIYQQRWAALPRPQNQFWEENKKTEDEVAVDDGWIVIRVGIWEWLKFYLLKSISK